MIKIKIGPAGSGITDEKGFIKLSNLGLNALEVEFTYGVWMKNDEARKLGKLASSLNIDLSVHAPYFINLSSEDKKKIEASKKRILLSCERAHLLNAKYVVFHAAYYGKKDKEEIYNKVKNEILDLQEKIKKQGYNVFLAPETTGKISQFGTLDELLKLSKETKCKFCIDFAHIKARQNGKIDYDEIFKKLKNTKHLHCHFSGIEYNTKGEKRHILTKEKDIKELFSYMIKYKVKATIINESPSPLSDALKMKKILDVMLKK